MPHALLLSPDDQAVSAITAVLDEMSVTCERPMDGPSAAKKLNSQSFDLVLVDCENLPAAKLIFDVCRRSQTGTNPVPIAIVDGRAGLPTAFRLGAELILTKPVAKDQARTTIRTAVSRVRKDETAKTIHPFEEPPAAPKQAPVESDTQAAAAAAGTGFGQQHSSPAAAPEAMTPRMSAAAPEMKLAPALREQPVFFTEKPVTAVPATDMFMPPPAPPAAKPSDDPVLADLESDLPTPPVFSSYAQAQKKSSASLWVLLFVMLTGGGLYAAWMYQPGFRERAQPQIDKFMGMIGQASGAHQAPAPHPAPAPAKAPETSQPTPVTTAPASDTVAAPPVVSTANSAPASTDAATPSPSVPVPAPAVAAEKPASDPAKAPASADSKKDTVATPAAEAELPGEKTAIILSSQGAEKRLIRHSAPVYPASARKAGIEGTVVLKTVVSETGAVQGVRLVEGNPALAAAAISAVKQWHYRPYMRDGKARPFQTIVLVEFQRQ